PSRPSVARSRGLRTSRPMTGCIPARRATRYSRNSSQTRPSGRRGLDRAMETEPSSATTFAPFRPRAPWFGPDLQTVRNTLRHRAPALSRYTVTRLAFEMSDRSGDRLVGHLQDPGPGSDLRPLVVLIHGLAGSAQSAYMETSAAHWLARGHRVLRLDLRGAGASRPLCRLQYHAGRTSDLRDALGGLPAESAPSGLLMIGYSLGG